MYFRGIVYSIFLWIYKFHVFMNLMIKNTSNPHHYNTCRMLVMQSLKNWWFWLEMKAQEVITLGLWGCLWSDKHTIVYKNYNTLWTFAPWQLNTKYLILTNTNKKNWCHNPICCIPKYHGVFLLQIKVSFKLSRGTGFLLCSV